MRTIRNYVLVTQTRKAIRIKLENGYCIWLPKSVIHNASKDRILVDAGIYQNNLNEAILDKKNKELKFLRSLKTNKSKLYEYIY
ncbi:hypothetical protein KJN74_02135 [Candidatus Bathyarchaeota archaeon]|nr:hypothetical protein [Candidatus Bathyarchaeota archaeon]